MDAENIQALLDKAHEQLESGEPAEVLRTLEKLQSIDLEGEDRFEAITLRAWALSELDHGEEAMALLDPLMEEYADSPRLRTTRGVVLSNLGDLEGARAELEAAVNADESDEVAMLNLALVCERLNDLDTALEIYKEAVERGVQLEWVLPHKASVEVELGDAESAKKTLRKYLAMSPDDAGQWITLAILHSDDQEYDKAYKCYRTAEKLDKDSSTLRLNWGITATRRGDLPTAQAQLAALEQLEPGQSRPLLLKAFILEEQGKHDAVVETYEAALSRGREAEPGDLAYALEMAMDYHARQKQVRRCEELLQEAYAANACTIELCEGYREATGEHLDHANWYSVMIEADYRPGLAYSLPADAPSDVPPRRYVRNFQMIARDRDEAAAHVLQFALRMGETNARLREFVSEEAIDDVFTGVYEIEPESVVIAGGDQV